MRKWYENFLISTFKKEQFQRKLFAEIRYLKIITSWCSLKRHNFRKSSLRRKLSNKNSVLNLFARDPFRNLNWHRGHYFKHRAQSTMMCTSRATLTKPKLATLPKPKIITNKKMRTHFLLCLVTISGNFDSICYMK